MQNREPISLDNEYKRVMKRKIIAQHFYPINSIYLNDEEYEALFWGKNNVTSLHTSVCMPPLMQMLQNRTFAQTNCTSLLQLMTHWSSHWCQRSVCSNYYSPMFSRYCWTKIFLPFSLCITFSLSSLHSSPFPSLHSDIWVVVCTCFRPHWNRKRRVWGEYKKVLSNLFTQMYYRSLCYAYVDSTYQRCLLSSWNTTKENTLSSLEPKEVSHRLSYTHRTLVPHVNTTDSVQLPDPLDSSGLWAAPLSLC